MMRVTEQLNSLELMRNDTEKRMIDTEKRMIGEPKDGHNIDVQGLFVPFPRVGSGDPVRVLRLLHNKYTGYN